MGTQLINLFNDTCVNNYTFLFTLNDLFHAYLLLYFH